MRHFSSMAVVFLAWLSAGACWGADGALTAGTWKGTYHYRNGGDPVNFSLTLQVLPNGAFTGTMFEPNSGFGPANEKELQAAVKGTYNVHTRALSFTKTYLYEKMKGHSVSYTGKLAADGKSISGSWTVGTTTGQFQMVKR